jgi:hypothetical protein
MSVYASSPDSAPDDDFEPGSLRHLVAGNRGRLLDPRRTPVSVVAVQSDIGFVLIRIEDFEDAGAVWQVPLEEIVHYQFEPEGPRAPAAAVAEMEAAIRRVARSQTIEPDDADRSRTETRIAQEQAAAGMWLAAHSRFLAQGRGLPDPSTRCGDPLLADDLEDFMRLGGLWDMEAAFARQYVSNPGSGEMVKGHRIVLAELGLAGYAGAIVRDPATFAGDWDREQRARHVITRLAFLRALFHELGIATVTLWRGFSTPTRLRRRDGRTFVSTTFAEAVARSHYQPGSETGTRGLVCREVRVDRLFMTYLETAAMNTTFHEAEAVVLDHRDDRWP